MSGATEPLRRPPSIRSTTTSSTDEDKRHEYAVIRKLLKQAVDSPGNAQGITVAKARKHVLIGGLKRIVEATAPSARDTLERSVTDGLKILSEAMSPSSLETMECSVIGRLAFFSEAMSPSSLETMERSVIGRLAFFSEAMSPSSLETMEHSVIGRLAFFSEATSPSSLGNVERSERLTPADMKRLAASGDRMLIAHVNSGAMRPAQLALAAELIGDMGDRASAERTLVSLLRHESPLVREGAVYGLAKLGSPSARETLRSVADGDRSPGVREAAAEALDA